MGIRNAVAVITAMVVLCGCSSLESPSASAPDFSASATDVNWAFADVTAMEQKVASLQSENARLSRRVMELESALDTVIATPADEAPAEEAPPLREKSLVDAGQQSTPLLRQPQNVIATSSGAVDSAPVAEAPRLVQPSFAATETIFENEAPLTRDGEIALSSVLWGVHLASYRAQDEARSGWRQLQQENPDELGLLEPRVEEVVIDGRGRFLRLIGGGFASEDKARTLCQSLEAKGLYCQVAGFGGERLSLAGKTG